MKSGNACYHSVQNLPSSSLLSTKIKIKIYRTVSLPVVFGSETWSLTLREERKQRRIFGPKKDEGSKKITCITKNFIIFTPHQI